MIKIYYFSGTGNTLWSAQKIAEDIGLEYELINMGLEYKKSEIFVNAEALVLLFPAYAYGAPAAVRCFIKKAVFKTPYAAVFTTFGTSPGGALAGIQWILERKNIGALYFGRIPAVENYIALFGPQKAKKIANRLQMQHEATKEAAQRVMARETNHVSRFRPFSILIFALFSAARKIFYRFYRVNADCDGCGICEKVCPVSALTLKKGRPQFSHECEHCQACLMWCPRRAIHFGRVNSSVQRYHHPDIDLAALSRQNSR